MAAKPPKKSLACCPKGNFWTPCCTPPGVPSPRFFGHNRGGMYHPHLHGTDPRTFDPPKSLIGGVLKGGSFIDQKKTMIP